MRFARRAQSTISSACLFVFPCMIPPFFLSNNHLQVKRFLRGEVVPNYWPGVEVEWVPGHPPMVYWLNENGAEVSPL